MDIIVTTPKKEMANAAAEAQVCIDAGGGEYFRRFPNRPGCFPVRLRVGDRVFYVEDGYIRGYAHASRVFTAHRRVQCDTTGRWWTPGFYVVMPADSWRWIRPIPMRGFRGYRYASFSCGDATPETQLAVNGWRVGRLIDAGDWLAPKPEVHQ